MGDLRVDDIIEIAKDLQNSTDTKHRLQSYQEGENAYFNEYDEESGGTRAMNGDGRPSMRTEEIRQDLDARARAISLMGAYVDDFVAIKSQLPLMTVDPESETTEDFDKAYRRTQILNWVWDNSRMILQNKRSGFHLSALGDSVLTLDYLFPPKGDIKKDDPVYEGGLKPPGCYIVVNHPGLCFPTFRTGVDMGELDEVVIVEKYLRRRARMKWGNLVSDDDDEYISVYYYYSRDHKAVVVDKAFDGDPFEHGLGFCPAQWLKNKEVGRLGQSDIRGAIQAHQEYQIMQLVVNDSIIQSVYPLTWIKDVQAFPDQLPLGANAVVPLGPTGQIGQLAPEANPQAGLALIANMKSGLDTMVGSASVQTESAINHSNISSRAVHATQGPMETRLGSQQDVVGQGFRSLNAKIMMSYSKMPQFKNTSMTIPTSGAKGAQKVEFMGSDFGDWWRNSVDWDAFAGSTRHERIVAALQLQGAKVVGKEYVAEQAGIRNARQEIARADAEQAKEMQQQMAMQKPQAAPGGPPGSTPPSSAGGPPGAVDVQAQANAPMDQALSVGAGGAPGGAPDPSTGSPGVSAQPPPPGPDFPPVDTPPSQPGSAAGVPDVVPVQAEADKLLAGIQLIDEDAKDIVVYEKPGGPIVAEISNWKNSSRVKAALKPLAGRGRKVVVQLQGGGGKNG